MFGFYELRQRLKRRIIEEEEDIEEEDVADLLSGSYQDYSFFYLHTERQQRGFEDDDD